ncbi:hypothetical protein GLYMA_18G005900v4 [Glycine max]|uniref:Uncharacterized protein n=1 Tax=Glycine max TaxID=3847 RepID=K7MP82_SOYBN|nr:hypothetical protein GYH30_048604 [Glycine max]KRG97407.1 hypothetical protein GLYMA_18G005900v4 [Glycine max]
MCDSCNIILLPFFLCLLLSFQQIVLNFTYNFNIKYILGGDPSSRLGRRTKLHADLSSRLVRRALPLISIRLCLLTRI